MSDVPPDIDIIVLDVDGGDMLRECLDSIATQTVASRRVIVFDNGSRTPVPDAIRSEVNLGFAGGVNAALKHSDAPFVALVNNDVVLDADWLATVRAAMDDDKLAGVQTVIRRGDGTIHGAGIDVRDGTIQQIANRSPVALASRSPLPARRSPVWGISATAA